MVPAATVDVADYASLGLSRGCGWFFVAGAGWRLCLGLPVFALATLSVFRGGVSRSGLRWALYLQCLTGTRSSRCFSACCHAAVCACVVFINLLLFKAVSVSKPNLKVLSVGGRQYYTKNIHFKHMCSHKTLIVGMVKTLLFLLQIIPCNIIHTSLMSQLQLCHAMHQFCFPLATDFFYFHLVAEILQPSELVLLFSPDFQLCSD